MYYKIINKECEVYKKLHKLRTEEEQIELHNLESIKEKTGLKFKNYLASEVGQQYVRRVTQYLGFEFIEYEKVNPIIWKRDKEHPEIFIPNRRSKLGREMADFLHNGLKYSNYNKPFEILKMAKGRKFKFPFIQICNDLIVIYLGDDNEPKDPNIIEITKLEFTSILEEKYG